MIVTNKNNGGYMQKDINVHERLMRLVERRGYVQDEISRPIKGKRRYGLRGFTKATLVRESK